MAARRTARNPFTRPLTADEVGAWRRFVRTAERCARDPLSKAATFARAAQRAGKMLLPPEQQTETSDLVALIRLGKRFLCLTGVERQQQAGEVARLAQASAEIVERAQDRAETATRLGRTGREPRRDIYG